MNIIQKLKMYIMYQKMYNRVSYVNIIKYLVVKRIRNYNDIVLMTWVIAVIGCKIYYTFVQTKLLLELEPTHRM